MANAGDQLYNEVIRRKMGELASKVRVREIIAYLACLTLSDQEEIEAKRETAGNYCAMMVLIDNLRRRQKWPEQFISALRTCEHWDLADELSEAYDRIRGSHTQKTDTAALSEPVFPDNVAPAASTPVLPVADASFSSAATAPTVATCTPAPSLTEASATVTMVTIQSVPHSTSTLLTPSDEAPANAETPPINSPPVPYNNIAAPLSTETSVIISASGAPIHPPLELANPAEPPPVTLLCSPVSVPTQTVSDGQYKDPVNSRETAMPGIIDSIINNAISGPSSTATPVLPTNPTSTFSNINKLAITSQSSASPKKSKIPVDVIEHDTSVKYPSQDTGPSETDLAQDSQNNTTINQAVGVFTAVSPNSQTHKTSQATTQVSPSASTDAIAGYLSNFKAEIEENVSKPGVLDSHITTEHSSVQPTRPQTVSNSHRAEEPIDEYVSVTTDDLMISSSNTTVPSQLVSFEPLAPVQNSNAKVLENGFLERDGNSYPSQPVEDHPKSPCKSMQTEPGTRMHTVEVSEGPPFENFSGQPPSMVRPTTIGFTQNDETESLVQCVSESQPSQHIHGISQCIQETDTSEQATTYSKPSPTPFQESQLNASGQNSIPQLLQREQAQAVLHQIQSNPRLITAAAIGLITVFVALRLRN